MEAFKKRDKGNEGENDTKWYKKGVGIPELALSVQGLVAHVMLLT